ncbi:leucine-rich repeat and guanylate kinase domain-containing protein isoform X1 [Accipiter gentilis]|uniref:leucine-rich repeat and guanylate kinase domain-containing protein isoform X1 n=1 Tax=Astur gentilis TaxID=8957 RepID=UPI0021105E11|nr:leucine-rich repeat and guanylate kinase domain-containing protein isoform X1 [Accipiter gentilis]
MAGGEEKQGEGGLSEPLPPSHGPPQHLSQGIPGELPQDGPSLRQPQLSLPHQEDKQEADDEEESRRTEGQFDGVLDEDTVAEGLHKLGRSAPGVEYVYLNLSLSGRELSDINILSRYVHLQKLELSYNKINDLSCISHMPHLLELNASNNELTTYFVFKPPKNLKEVDFSYNQIPKMQDLSAYQSLTILLLDYNNIEEIRGLEKCHSLTHLSLSHNRLIAISGLENLPIRILNLSSNQIEKVTGLDSLKTLQKLDLSSNKITSLEGLEKHDLLEMINLEDNQIAELRELEYIEDLPLLRVLNLLKNPVQEQRDYWLLVIFMVLQLTELDLKKISVEEKVAAVNKYDPPPEVVAARDHMTHVMYSMLQPQRIFDSTLPSLDAPYPMLVLVGPLACGKRELTHKICRQFNNFFRYGPCHTTRAAYFGEENRLDYYFVSQEVFDKMVNTGKFIATYKYSGYYYGLGRDTVESIAREGLATCVHLEIEGVRSLKNTYFKPRYILLVPMNKEKYEGHLRRKGLFSRPEIEEAVSRVDMYIRISQGFPGYFDAVVNTDELDEAFTELSFLVKAYLGLEPPAVFDSIQDLNSRAGAGSRIRLLQEQRLSPGSVITGTTRSSSVNEFLDSSAKNYPGSIPDNLAAQLGSVEEASLQRRRSAARQALSGKAPSACVQLFQRDLAVTPAPSSSHQQLLEPTIHTSRDKSFPLTNPESRKNKLKKAIRGSRESGPASGRFLISAGTHAAEGLLVQTPVPHAHLTEEAKAEHQDPRGAENRVDRSKETELLNDNLQIKTSKSKTGSSHVPQLIKWPGSHSKPVLPPIPSGQKKTNP